MRNKYHNVRVVNNGHVFDSKTESSFYNYLLFLQKAGEVKRIRLQVPYILQRAFVRGGKKYAAIKYVADFVVTYGDGHIEVIDVKGSKAMITQVFKLKRKMFLKKYPNKTLVVIVPIRSGWLRVYE